MSSIEGKAFPEFYKDIEDGPQLLKDYAEYEALVTQYNDSIKEFVDLTKEQKNFVNNVIWRFVVTCFIWIANLFGAKWEDRGRVIKNRIAQLSTEKKLSIPQGQDRIWKLICSIQKQEFNFGTKLIMHLFGGEDKFNSLPLLKYPYSPPQLFCPAIPLRDIENPVSRGIFHDDNTYLLFVIKVINKNNPKDVRGQVFGQFKERQFCWASSSCQGSDNIFRSAAWNARDFCLIEFSSSYIDFNAKFCEISGNRYYPFIKSPSHLKLDAKVYTQLKTLLTNGQVEVPSPDGKENITFMLAN